LTVDPYKLLCEPEAEFLPFLHMALLFKNPDMLPELLSLMGREKLKSFLLKFEGQTVTFPTWESVASSVTDAYLLWKVGQVPERDTITKRKLEAEFGLPWEALRSRAEALKEVFEPRRDT
jgi:hypothetical protein